MGGKNCEVLAFEEPVADDDLAFVNTYKCYSAEGSGTSRLPAAEGGSHSGLHIDAGDNWMVMAHGYAWGVYTDQSGPRGDDKVYVQSMAMLNAEKQTGWGKVQLKSMLSLEPIMDPAGYPNLFATGETAGGLPPGFACQPPPT